jgi:hypothetical protein
MMTPRTSDAPTVAERDRDGVATAALTVVRRAYVEGVPITRELFAHEVSVTLEMSDREAMAHVDAVAQQLGVSSLD